MQGVGGLRGDLQDAFDALPLGVVSLVAVQLAVGVADELQQPLGLDVHQHGVLQGTAVLRQGLQTALTHPLLREGRGETGGQRDEGGERKGDKRGGGGDEGEDRQKGNRESSEEM